MPAPKFWVRKWGHTFDLPSPVRKGVTPPETSRYQEGGCFQYALAAQRQTICPVDWTLTLVCNSDDVELMLFDNV